jgi:hypothetical protein
MTVRSQAGYTDVRAEMAAVDKLGPLARALFNESPRELSAKDITAAYLRMYRVKNLRAPRNDKKFAAWLREQYRLRTGHDPVALVLVPKRVRRPL